MRCFDRVARLACSILSLPFLCYRPSPLTAAPFYYASTFFLTVFFNLPSPVARYFGVDFSSFSPLARPRSRCSMRYKQAALCDRSHNPKIHKKSPIHFDPRPLLVPQLCPHPSPEYQIIFLWCAPAAAQLLPNPKCLIMR